MDSSAPKPTVSFRALRATIVGIAAGAAIIQVANVLLVVWIVAPTSVAVGPPDLDLIAAGLLSAVAWGLGFAVLGLVIALRGGHREETVVAGLFLSIYSLWAALSFSAPFEAVWWRIPVHIVFDVLCHSIGIRFTQLFPRRLTATDVLGLTSGRMTRPVARALAALVKPQVYWPVALTFEVVVWVGRFWLNVPLPAAHLLIWLILGVTYLYAGYRSGGSEERRRILNGR